MFMMENLWTIYEMLREECNDGDNFSPDLTNGLALFVAALNGANDTDYDCMKNVNKEAALSDWNKNYPEIKNQYEALLLHSGPVNRMKELSVAFKNGNRNEFDKIVEDGLKNM